MGSCALVLSAHALTILIVAVVAAVFASFAGQALAQAASRWLAESKDTSIAISGALNAAQAHTDTTAVPTLLRGVFGAVPVPVYRSLWSHSLGLPASYGKAPIPLTQAASPDGIAARAALIQGTWPGVPVRGQPIPAALPAAAAVRLRLSVDDVLSVRDRNTGARVRLRIVGLFRPHDPATPYWRLDLIGTGGAASAGGFITYGPLVVNPVAFSNSDLAVGYASWVAAPLAARIGEGDLRPVAEKLTQAASLLQAQQFGLQVTTNLPGLLTGLAASLTVARSLLAIGAILLLLLAVAAVTLSTRLLAGQRDTESALLSARGSSRWQLARLTAAEVLPIAAVSAVAGALLGSRLADLLSRAGPLHSVGIRISGVPAGAWWAAAAAAFCVLTALGSAVRRFTPGAARVSRGRQAAAAGIIKAGGDLALVALAALAVWQLRRYSAVAGSLGGGIGVDPVLAAAPAIALLGGTIVLMRLLPAASRGADRLASFGRRLPAALATWEFSRRPIRQSGAALIAVLAVATGVLALAQRDSWQRSARDQADFATGAQVRVDTTGPVPPAQAASFAGSAGNQGAMPVARIPSTTATGVVLALDTRKAPATVLLRPDLSRLHSTALWKPLAPATVPAVTLPGRPARLGIDASLGPAGIQLGQPLVTVSVQDATGLVYSVPAGALPPDGHSHTLVASLAPQRRAVYPLRLLAISLAYTMPPAKTQDAVLAIRGFTVSPKAAGAFPAPFTAGRVVRKWSPTTSSEPNEAEFAITPPAAAPAVAGWQTTSSGAQSLTFTTGHALLPPSDYPAFAANVPAEPVPAVLVLTARTPGTPTVAPIPGIATRAYLDATKAAVGGVVTAVVNGVTIPVRIVASVTAFPTVTGQGGALIIDQATVQEILAAESADPLQVNEWWLPAGAALPRLPAGSAVTDRAAMTAALLGDPVSNVPQQALLAVAIASALLAAVGFAVSVATSTVERRSQDALLAALGLSRAARAWLFCLEQVMLSVPSAAAGLLLGAALGRLLIPAVTLTSAATAPVPPPVAVFPWTSAAVLALAVAMTPVLAAAATAARHPDPAAALRAAESR
jgi:hypothetical protein